MGYHYLPALAGMLFLRKSLMNVDVRPTFCFCGVADLWYERLNLQKMKPARQNSFGISNLSIFLP
ncbi:hypothetical protein Osc7112_4445 [Oscillatoria nigro-viridis PCC 7112]|uniref:Uncharacterized protein n=1 Tax=Phormidium nigroviride PCC 7112 TaxID=179408 RepID=K9VMI2_9CYAN|nr:hypothetical protein Osc7112_4445 [Oscillatoria nigro-viridis PCC 7112]